MVNGLGMRLVHTQNRELTSQAVASFLGSPAPYTGRTWYLFLREHDVMETDQNFQNRKATFYTLFIQLYTQCSVCRILTEIQWDKLSSNNHGTMLVQLLVVITWVHEDRQQRTCTMYNVRSFLFRIYYKVAKP